MLRTEYVARDDVFQVRAPLNANTRIRKTICIGTRSPVITKALKYRELSFSLRDASNRIDVTARC